MARRTSTLKVLPWVGGLNTSTDEMLLPTGSLTVADNVTFSYNHEKRRREGINYEWDSRTVSVTSRSSSGTTRTLSGNFEDSGIEVGDVISLEGSDNDDYNGTELEVTAVSGTELQYTAPGSLTEASTPETGAVYQSDIVVGGIDYWFGSEDSKGRYIVYVLSNGAVYRNASGISTRIPDGGLSWDLPLTEANLEVFQNRVVIAVSGLNNRMKYWDGNPVSPLRDLPANYKVNSLSRYATSFVRLLTFGFEGDTPPVQVGDTILIGNAPAIYGTEVTVQDVTDNLDNTFTIEYAMPEEESDSATDDTITIGVPAPLALFVREHAGGLWCNDKTRLDRLHYSGADIFQWGGVGNSGALDIGEGDGDPNGISGIAPSFKGTLFVGKRTKLYRIDIGYQGDFDASTVTKVSNGIGFVSHQGIAAVDQDDVVFVSDRGFHSLAATDAYGDFSASYLSADIQRTFVEEFTEGRRRYIKAAYIPQINSAIFAVSEDGSALNNSIYLLNVELKAWYRWPNVSAEALISAQDPDKRRVYFGTSRGTLAQAMTGGNQDTAYNGDSQVILSRVSTGLIMPDSRPDTIKGFKTLRIVYASEGSYTITAKIKIDNFSEQAIAFVSNSQSVPLGQFILGEDVLGGSYVTAPYSLPVDGWGRTVKLTIEQNDLNTALAVQGFLIEFWGGDVAQETRYGDQN